MNSLGRLLKNIEPGTYGLIVGDSFYRFVPAGVTENDNAGVMAMYNTIDGYMARLGRSGLELPPREQGQPSRKGRHRRWIGGRQPVPGSGHPPRSAPPRNRRNLRSGICRAASSRPNPAVAIRSAYPLWEIDHLADPSQLKRPGNRGPSQEERDRRLDEDRMAIAAAMQALPSGATKTTIRDLSRVGNPRFGQAWASLVADGTVTTIILTKGNNRTYEGFTLGPQE